MKKTIIFILSILLIGCDEEPVKVVYNEEIRPSPFCFTEPNVTEAVYIENGDILEFKTCGVWVGAIVLESSKDKYVWVPEDSLFPPFLSVKKSNITFQSYCLLEDSLVGGLEPNTYYRFRMALFAGGKCNYSFSKSVKETVMNEGFQFLEHDKIPPGDAGISTGQLIGGIFNYFNKSK